MPIKNYQRFEKYFYTDGDFNRKIYEQYWGDDNDNDDDDDDGYDYNTEWPEPIPPHPMLNAINYSKLALIGLLEYQDIVEKCIEWFESQISTNITC